MSGVFWISCYILTYMGGTSSGYDFQGRYSVFLFPVSFALIIKPPLQNNCGTNGVLRCKHENSRQHIKLVSFVTRKTKLLFRIYTKRLLSRI